MTDMTIEARGLCKRYGSTTAVDGLSFTVEAGRVTGFVGPNGAGKSTTLRMMLGLDRPDSGAALIGGQDYTRLADPLSTVGALLDCEALHPGRRARDHLLWLAHYNGLPSRRVDLVLDQVGLASAAKKRAGGFSLGMRQRLGIAAALLGDPPVLILDEPVNGLDPEGVQWIRRFLKSLAAEGRTVLVSSHLMSELQDTADHVIVIGRGRLLADTGVAALLDEASGERVALRTGRRAEALAVLAGADATVAVTGPDSLTVTGLAAEEVVARLGAHGIPFSELARHRATLEEAYMELTGAATEFTAQEASS
ncbi:ATP-binding cassette domain-containing protein [Streptomyces sp. SID8379]|uniref:ABC transporter ATP-binding protein n=1 Tax=unclassified Streptomyces TaxID=2593676 RepID=UPI00039F9F6B|nr:MULTISPECIES: ABC transporter ATP-binding protein [unclassified Streptomyces]MYW68850.1 ATP-binding cassette domain-containing protein [Streptomyces sp. SID8379]